MKKMDVLILLATALTLSGCGKVLSDYVSGGSRTPASPADPGNANSNAIRVSPGAVWAQGTHVQVNARLLPTNVKATGTHVDAKISINQNRPN